MKKMATFPQDDCNFMTLMLSKCQAFVPALTGKGHVHRWRIVDWLSDIKVSCQIDKQSWTNSDGFTQGRGAIR